MTYSSTPQGENTYLVKLDTGETFICVVAASPDELDGLVNDHIQRAANPVGYSAPLLSDLKIATITKVRALRTQVFATLAGIQSQALANADTTTAKAISNLQDMLKALPDIDLSKCKTQADIDSAFKSAWAAIVAAAPANVASAFNGLVTL